MENRPKILPQVGMATDVDCPHCKTTNTVPLVWVDRELTCPYCTQKFKADLSSKEPTKPTPEPKSPPAKKEPEHESKLSVLFLLLAIGLVGLAFEGRSDKEKFDYIDSGYPYDVLEYVTRVEQEYGVGATYVATLFYYYGDEEEAMKEIRKAEKGSGLELAVKNNWRLPPLTHEEQQRIVQRYHYLQEERPNLERRTKLSARLWDSMAYIGLAAVSGLLGFICHKKKAW